jgi:hypothetical protein
LPTVSKHTTVTTSLWSMAPGEARWFDSLGYRRVACPRVRHPIEPTPEGQRCPIDRELPGSSNLAPPYVLAGYLSRDERTARALTATARAVAALVAANDPRDLHRGGFIEKRLNLRRVYDGPSPAYSVRVSVDRVWPHGLAKAAIRLDDRANLPTRGPSRC